MVLISDNILTIKNLLKKKFPDSSYRTILSWIKNKRVSIDGVIVKKSNQLVKKSQEIKLISKEKILPHKIKLIYEDAFILVIDKPTNLLSVPKEEPNSINVLKILRKEYDTQDIFAVHRIDRETSGLLVFAKSFTILEKLKLLFKNHDIERKYLAVVEGYFPEDSGTFVNFLYEKKDLKVAISDENYGEKAITHFTTLYRNKNYSFLSLSLETGKKHQIRVQLKEKGFPVLGDTKYGNKKNPFNRMALHAYLLKFIHPATGKKMNFVSSLPDKFSALGADKIKHLLL